MRSLTSWVGAALVGLATVSTAQTPPGRMPGTDGKFYTAGSLAQRTTIVVFLKIDCPMNPKQIPNLNRLAESLPNGVRMIALTKGNRSQAGAYARKVGLRFPLIADETGSTIKSLGAKRSLDVLGFRGGSVQNRTPLWEGVSQGNLTALFRALPAASFGGRPPSVTYFGTNVASGCMFR